MANSEPASQQPTTDLSPTLKPLVDQLAALSDEERREVITAARQAARKQRDADPEAARQRRWDWLMSMKGIVSLGGNAVEDCERLYDDV